MIAFFSDPTIIILVCAALIAGFVDSIAGGGGLITLPAILLTGAPPVSALGTNKLQGIFGSLSAMLTYARAGHVNFKKQRFQSLMAFIGGVTGALVALVLPVTLLQTFLPILLIIVAIYFAFKPNLNDIDKAERIKPIVFCLTMAPLIGFYDGLCGPGAGAFYMLAYVSLSGMGILKATAHTKLLNFASNVGSLITFAFVGTIDCRIGLSMGIAQFIGAQAGARVAMKIGSQLIKPLLVIICLALAIKLLWDPQNPLRLFLHF